MRRFVIAAMSACSMLAVATPAMAQSLEIDDGIDRFYARQQLNIVGGGPSTPSPAPGSPDHSCQSFVNGFTTHTGTRVTLGPAPGATVVERWEGARLMCEAYTPPAGATVGFCAYNEYDLNAYVWHYTDQDTLTSTGSVVWDGNLCGPV